ncbi:hypothetical protein [Scytonema sp. HK-05]|uniref:hypothetical protein n=1 Tax=Scytonema sp. HK-05 TaxID=1137095 RepID=UPI0009365EC0|nr:hypothetical protein [Scytonema sp. HK-05]OKH54176.1 hypothetical protein NIES2130_29315 [Scytonema sp. HK-05]
MYTLNRGYYSIACFGRSRVRALWALARSARLRAIAHSAAPEAIAVTAQFFLSYNTKTRCYRFSA